MNQRSLTLSLVLALLFTVYPGCAREVIIRERPPAARVEVYSVRPSPDHVWIPGHWRWEGEWIWEKGHWDLPPRERAAWVPGHWVERPGGWFWVEGHWR